jgi:hypothetical protein
MVISQEVRNSSWVDVAAVAVMPHDEAGSSITAGRKLVGAPQCGDSPTVFAAVVR